MIVLNLRRLDLAIGVKSTPSRGLHRRARLMADRDQSSELTRDAAILLTILGRRSPLDGPELKKALSHQVDQTSVGFDDLFKEAVSNRWIEKIPSGWVLSTYGAKVLAEEGDAASTEEEDLGAADHPLKPYDVAKLKVEQKPLSVFQALRKIEKGEIVLDPEFQRAFVWDEVRQSRLIESILIRIPLPAFYLDATDEVRWSVVDGLQRLSTLHRFCRGESFPLTGLEFLAELSGRRFLELPQKYQVLIEDDTQLIFNNLLPGTPVKAKFTIFSRVNTGGMLLTAQEIRHALQQGKITKLLRVLTRSTEFLKTTGGALESLRMTDREVTLRALSFMAFSHESYRRFDDLDAFLVDSMEKFNSEFTDEALASLAAKFKDSLLKVHSIFGRYAFRKYYEVGGRRGPFNKALFESWVSAVRPYHPARLSAKKRAIEEAFIFLISNDMEFVKSITSSTSKLNSVRKRFTALSHLLGSVVGDN